MTKHDYQAAAEYFALHGGEIPNGIHRSTMAALRAAAARQEQEEAVERGEAVRVSESAFVYPSPTTFEPDKWVGWIGSRNAPSSQIPPLAPAALITAIVPLPRPQEIEAEVE